MPNTSQLQARIQEFSSGGSNWKIFSSKKKKKMGGGEGREGGFSIYSALVTALQTIFLYKYDTPQCFVQANQGGGSGGPPP